MWQDGTRETLQVTLCWYGKLPRSWGNTAPSYPTPHTQDKPHRWKLCQSPKTATHTLLHLHIHSQYTRYPNTNISSFQAETHSFNKSSDQTNTKVLTKRWMRCLVSWDSLYDLFCDILMVFYLVCKQLAGCVQSLTWEQYAEWQGQDYTRLCLCASGVTAC